MSCGLPVLEKLNRVTSEENSNKREHINIEDFLLWDIQQSVKQHTKKLQAAKRQTDFSNSGTNVGEGKFQMLRLIQGSSHEEGRLMSFSTKVSMLKYS